MEATVGRIWRGVAIALACLLFAQYAYYSILSLMYQSQVSALHKRVEDQEQMRGELVALRLRVETLEGNDYKLLKVIEDGKKALSREIEVVENRLGPVKEIKRVN